MQQLQQTPKCSLQGCRSALDAQLLSSITTTARKVAGHDLSNDLSTEFVGRNCIKHAETEVDRALQPAPALHGLL